MFSGFSKSMSSTIPKGIMEAFEKRRSNIIAKHNHLQVQNNEHSGRKAEKSRTNYMYDNPTFLSDE